MRLDAREVLPKSAGKLSIAKRQQASRGKEARTHLLHVCHRELVPSFVVLGKLQVERRRREAPDVGLLRVERHSVRGLRVLLRVPPQVDNQSLVESVRSSAVVECLPVDLSVDCGTQNERESDAVKRWQRTRGR